MSCQALSDVGSSSANQRIVWNQHEEVHQDSMEDVKLECRVGDHLIGMSDSELEEVISRLSCSVEKFGSFLPDKGKKLRISNKRHIEERNRRLRCQGEKDDEGFSKATDAEKQVGNTSSLVDQEMRCHGTGSEKLEESSISSEVISEVVPQSINSQPSSVLPKIGDHELDQIIRNFDRVIQGLNGSSSSSFPKEPSFLVNGDVPYSQNKIPYPDIGNSILYKDHFQSDTASSKLRDIFKCCGKVVDSFIPLKRRASRGSRFGFIRFHNKSEALEAIRIFKDDCWFGYKIFIDLAFPRPKIRKDPHQFSSHKPPLELWKKKELSQVLPQVRSSLTADSHPSSTLASDGGGGRGEDVLNFDPFSPGCSEVGKPVVVIPNHDNATVSFNEKSISLLEKAKNSLEINKGQSMQSVGFSKNLAEKGSSFKVYVKPCEVRQFIHADYEYPILDCYAPIAKFYKKIYKMEDKFGEIVKKKKKKNKKKKH